MRKIFLTSISSITLISTLTLSTNTYAAHYNNIDEAKKDHPNADFKVNKNDGTFSYSYDKQDQQSALNTKHRETNQSSNSQINNQTHHHQITNPSSQNNSVQLSPFQNEAPNIDRNQQNHNQPPEAPGPQNHTNDQGDNLNETDTPQPVKPPKTPDNKDEAESNDTKNAYHKDKHGMITSIDTDELYDELQIAEFNEKAKTKDGKPLAIGNGKIIDQPLFTDKNNLYTSGQCTWYVFDKRAQDGHTISTFWGDARNWAGQASSAGFKVDHSPKEGSIMQTINGPYGHVAYVERVNKDGSIFISEMNWIAPYIVSTRTISASEVGSYNFIH